MNKLRESFNIVRKILLGHCLEQFVNTISLTLYAIIGLVLKNVLLVGIVLGIQGLALILVEWNIISKLIKLNQTSKLIAPTKTEKFAIKALIGAKIVQIAALIIKFNLQIWSMVFSFTGIQSGLTGLIQDCITSVTGGISITTVLYLVYRLNKALIKEININD